MIKNRGFTLIEILIALAVFAILATLTSSAMYHAFNARARVTEQANRLNNLQLAMVLIKHDIEQTIPREVRGNEMHLFPAFVGEPQYLELTRGGLVNPEAEEKRSSLKRIALLCSNNQLIRRSWDRLDTTDRNHYQDKVLVDNLAGCRFGYLSRNLQILPEWRAASMGEQENQRAETLPKAVQFNLTLKDWGKMSLLFIIPEALYG